MGIFEELAEELGIGQDSIEADLAADLAQADATFLAQLIALRRTVGLTQENLGRAWGRHKTAVSQFERPGADPRLSTIRRYAASIGVRYTHIVALDPYVHPHIDVVDPRKVFAAWSVASEPREALPVPPRCEFSLMPIPRSEPDTITRDEGTYVCR